MVKPHNLIYTRGTRLWYAGEPPVYLYLIDLEYIGKDYANTQPERPWEATLISIDKATMRFLYDFPVGCVLLIAYKDAGRPDVFSPENVIGKLSDCQPKHAWIDDLVHREIDELVTYKLEIACEFELFPENENG